MLIKYVHVTYIKHYEDILISVNISLVLVFTLTRLPITFNTKS